MKKNVMLLFTALLGACSIHAGDAGFLKDRGFNIDVSDSYVVGGYDKDKTRLLKSEYVEERNFKINENQMVRRGGSVLNNKIYRKDFYVRDELKANKDAWLHSASVPLKVSKNKVMNVAGVVNVDGSEYRLVESDMKNFVFLVDGDGKLFKKMGQLKNGKMILMPTHYVVTPEDVRFEEVYKNSAVQTKPIKGFDIKYDGVKAGRMWFTYLDYDGSDSNGKFQEVSFPAKPGLIEINGVGFRVTAVDDNKIEYVVVKYQ